MTLRTATPRDHDRLQDLFLACRRHATWLPAHARSGDLAHDAYGMHQVLAEDRRGRLHGFVAFAPDERFVHHLYVDPALRRAGVARRLLASACASAAGRWNLKCLCTNLVAMRCYARLGWQPHASGLDDDGRFLLLQSPDPA